MTWWIPAVDRQWSLIRSSRTSATPTTRPRESLQHRCQAPTISISSYPPPKTGMLVTSCTSFYSKTVEKSPTSSWTITQTIGSTLHHRQWFKLWRGTSFGWVWDLQGDSIRLLVTGRAREKSIVMSLGFWFRPYNQERSSNTILDSRLSLLFLMKIMFKNISRLLDYIKLVWATVLCISIFNTCLIVKIRF